MYLIGILIFGFVSLSVFFGFVFAGLYLERAVIANAKASMIRYEYGPDYRD